MKIIMFIKKDVYDFDGSPILDGMEVEKLDQFPLVKGVEFVEEGGFESVVVPLIEDNSSFTSDIDLVT